MFPLAPLAGIAVLRPHLERDSREQELLRLRAEAGARACARLERGEVGGPDVRDDGVEEFLGQARPR